MGVLNATTASLVSVLGEALATEAWAGPGISSAEHWVTWQCGVSRSRAANLMRMARRLPELARCAEAFTAGALSEDQAALVARHCPPERDEEVTGLAQLMLVPQLRQLLATVPRPEPEPAVPERRHLAFGTDEEGNLWLRGSCRPTRVPWCSGRWRPVATSSSPSGPEGEATSPVDWGDALVRTAELALGSGPSVSPLRTQVVVHVEAESLAAHLQSGAVLTDGLARFLSCDATVRTVLERNGVPQAMGTPTRTVDERLRLLVNDRDRGCRVPGCGQRRWVQVHHLVHWRDGGPTRLDNLCCLCPRHHRMHHMGQLGIEGDPTRPDGLVFTNAAGLELGAARPRPPGDPPARAAQRLGVPEPSWRHPLGERMDWRWFTWN